MTSRIIRVKGNGGSRVFEAHSPHSPIPVVFTADSISVGGALGVSPGYQVATVLDSKSRSTVVALFPVDWAIVEVASKIEDNGLNEFQFGQMSEDPDPSQDFDTHGNYDVPPGD